MQSSRRLKPEYELDIFDGASDVYRDPCDDFDRTCACIVFALLLVSCAALCAGSAYFLVHLQQLGPSFIPLTPLWLIGVIFGIWFLFGATFLCLSIYFFRIEIPHWSLKGMRADRFVAGLILFGMALIYTMADYFVHSHAHTQTQVDFVFGGAIVGALFVAAGFGIGILYALAEKFQERPRKLVSVRVERRYGLDVNLVPHEDWVTPHMDGMEAVIICKTRDGVRLDLRASPTAYEFAEPGKIGTIVVRGRHLDSFSTR